MSEICIHFKESNNTSHQIMGLFDNIWPKSSYLSMAKGAEEAKRKRQTAAPLLAEDRYNNYHDTCGEASQSHKMLRRQFNTDTKSETTDEYEVRINDNINSIAARFWTTPAVIKQLNRLSTNHLFVGQMILVPKTQTTKDSKPNNRQ